MTIIVTRYLFKEILPQFFFTLVVFCAVIEVSQLVRLSSVLVAFGLTFENILLPFLYIIVPFLPIIIPMSYLFGTMLSFARLSADGELTALQAAGYGLPRCLLPALVIALFLYGAAAISAMHLEAWGRREFVQFIYRKTQTEIDNMVRFKIQAGVFLNDFLDYTFYTEGISSDRSQYYNVLLAPRPGSSGDFIIMAPRAEITGTVTAGDLRMVLHKGLAFSLNPSQSTPTELATQGPAQGQATSLSFQRVEIDLLRVFQEKILGEDTAKDDYRSYTAQQLYRFIREKQQTSDTEDQQAYVKAAYLYYSRIANPFIIFAFTFFALMLGIQDQRHSKSQGFLGAILTLMVCFVTLVGFRWIAEHALLPLQFAVWFPSLSLTCLGGFCLYQKSRLPPSEPILAWRNLPFKRRHPRLTSPAKKGLKP